MQAPDPTLSLTGEHVVIEPMGERHLEGLAAAAADPTLWRYLPIAPPNSPELLRAWMDAALSARDRGDEVPFVLVHRESGAVAGSTRYLDISTPHCGLEIGWTFVAPELQRTALNTEAKLLLLEHAFNELGAVRVCIKTDGRNIRAQRAIERLGAVREGTLRRHRVLPDGYIRDTVYYSIIAEEWPAVCKALQGFLSSSR